MPDTQGKALAVNCKVTAKALIFPPKQATNRLQTTSISTSKQQKSDYKQVTAGGKICLEGVNSIRKMRFKNNLYPIQRKYTPQIVEKQVPLHS